MDFKTQVKSILKTNLSFKSTKKKIVSYKKGDKLAGISTSHKETLLRIRVSKRYIDL